MAVRCEKIKKDTDFKTIFKTGKTATGRFVFLKIKKTKEKNSRFAVVAGLKTSKKAVERNKAKRRIKAVIGKIWPELTRGNDIVIIVKKEAITQKFSALKEDLIKTINRAGLFIV